MPYGFPMPATPPSKTPPPGRPFVREADCDERPTWLSTDCREALEREYLSSVGSASAILVVAVSPEELKTLALDNVSGFLLSLMDGATDAETILDISGLPRLLALRHLRSLLERGVVVIASGTRAR
jgi:hypothetical protein